MKYIDFQKLPEEVPENPQIGDLFLTGKLIEQKGDMPEQNKNITYYKIIKVGLLDYSKNIEYITVYDTIEY